MSARRLLSLLGRHRGRMLVAAPPRVAARWAGCGGRSYSAQSDAELREILRSEIEYEESSGRTQDHQGVSLGNYSLDWDDPQSEDVFMKRRYGKEDIAVSALLGPEDVQGKASLPRTVLMKIFVSKHGSSSLLQFDCGISIQDNGKSDFHIVNAYYLSSPTSTGTSNYRGPIFSTLDPQLQKAFKGYLVERGITQEFTEYLLLHLHEKEQFQYVNWLRRLENML